MRKLVALFKPCAEGAERHADPKKILALSSKAENKAIVNRWLSPLNDLLQAKLITVKTGPLYAGVFLQENVRVLEISGFADQEFFLKQTYGDPVSFSHHVLANTLSVIHFQDFLDHQDLLLAVAKSLDEELDTSLQKAVTTWAEHSQEVAIGGGGWSPTVPTYQDQPTIHAE